MFQVTRDSIKKFIVWLMMLNDTPHSIAMGVAMGWFVALTPTLGVQMLLVVAISIFVRLNRTAGCAMVWLTNPMTAVPVYFFNYLVGTWILRIRPLGMDEFGRRLIQAFHHEYWHEKLIAVGRALGRLTLDLAGPLWLGSFIVAVGGAVPLYFVVRRGVIAYRQAHQRRLEAALHRESAAVEPAPDQRKPEESTDGKTLQDR